MRFADLVGTSDAVARAGGRLEKIAMLASFLKRAAPEEIEIATAAAGPNRTRRRRPPRRR